MTKEGLIGRLQDIEWDDFEVKKAKTALPKNIWETFGKEPDYCQTVPVCEIVGECRFRDKQTAELERVDGKRCDYKKREGLCPGDAASYIE